MKGKTILGILVAAILFVVLDQVMTTQKENANKRFQEALEEYDKSSSVQYNSVVQQQKMVDAQELKEKHEQSLFPTKGEIDSVNTRLPILVSEGTLNTKIEYNENTKVQTFYYRFTKEVDENLITQEVLDQLKANMIVALKKSPNNIKRLNAGMTFLYVYSSVKNKKLYEIEINSNDIK